MRGLLKWTIAPALAGLLAGSVVAQQAQPGQSGQPGQAGKPGAPGQPGQSVGQGFNPARFGQLPPFFTDPSTRRELNINDDQFRRLNEASERIRGQFRDDLSGLDRLKDKERETRINDLNRRFSTDFNRSAGEVLNEQQLRRFRQLELQQRSFGAFTDPAIRRELNLTDRQVDELRRLNELRAREVAELRKNPQGNRDEQLKRLREFERETGERINRIFNDEQRRLWGQMTGEPFFFGPGFGETTPTDRIPERR